MKANIEIERKFLVVTPPTGQPDKTHIIESAYLSAYDPEVRIARYQGEPNSYQVTIKGGKGISRKEVIVNVSDEVGEMLWLMTDPDFRIRKVRDWYGDWEIDTYLGRHNPLVVAEIELPDADAVLPVFPYGAALGEEVTYDPEFKNKALALLGPADAAELLSTWQLLTLARAG
jgi:CYTH domain-containing protein